MSSLKTMSISALVLMFAAPAFAASPGLTTTAQVKIGPISASVVAQFGNGSSTTVSQNSPINASAIGQAGIGLSAKVLQTGMRNISGIVQGN